MEFCNGSGGSTGVHHLCVATWAAHSKAYCVSMRMRL